MPSYADIEAYALALQAVENDLKALAEKVEALRYTILTQNHVPPDLFALLAHHGCQFLTAEELAALFKVDRRTIYSLRGRGLPPFRVGKELRFDPLAVAEWLKNRQRLQAYRP